MPNEQNLIPYQKTSSQSREEAAINGRKGGIASGESKRRRKAFKEALDILLEKEFVDSSGTAAEGIDVLAAKAFQKAAKGDMKAMEFIRDTVGEKPVERVESVEIPQEVYERVRNALED